MSKPAPARYKTTNWAKYDAALKARGSLLIWLDTNLQWQAEPFGKPGRSATFSDAAIQFCLSIKSLFGLALRQTIGLVESLIKLAGLDWQVPNFSTLSRRQHSIAVTIPAQKHGRGLQLLIDSTGIQFLGEGEWKRKKHGAEYRRQWRKVHLGIDADTLEIRAIDVTGNGMGDAPMLPEILNQIPSDEPIASVSPTTRTIPKPATRPLRHVTPKPSSRFARMAGRGRRMARGPGRGAKFYVRPEDWARPSGSAGVATIGVAWSKRRCAASNGWVSASWRGRLNVRWPSCRFARHSSTASRSWAGQLRCAWGNCVWGKGKPSLQAICATKPGACRKRHWQRYPRLVHPSKSIPSITTSSSTNTQADELFPIKRGSPLCQLGKV